MAKGKAKVDYLGKQGGIVMSTTPDWGFIYSKSLVKDSKWNVGDRAVLPDGREFRYAKSSAACLSGQGCEFTATGYVAITTFATGHAVGVTKITVPAATHAALAEDELRGGYAVIYDGTTNNVQFREIVGNQASILNVAFDIELDGGLSEAVVSAVSKIEVFQNPYGALRTGTTNELAKAGVPATAVSAASTYFWVQVKGPCWVAPQATVTGNEIGCMWRHDGSLIDVEVAIGGTTSANNSTQYAGHTIEGNYTGNGPLFMLGM